jgi:hypothetical protein
MKTLGEFYREKILSREDLITRELPGNSGEIKIERDLFGWKLYSGKNFIECRSEEYARYLKVFIDAGMTKICVPRDDEYLKIILPELEQLKTRVDGVINSYLEAIMDNKTKAKLKHSVFMEIMK